MNIPSFVEGLNVHLALFILALLPLIEPRYAIIVGLSMDVDPLEVFFIATVAVIILAITLSAFINVVDKLILSLGSRISFIEKIYASEKQRAGKSLSRLLRKWGFLGLVAFIAIPLPFTGIYTGALGAFVLGIRGKNAFLALMVGGFLSIIITSLFGYSIT